jgi:hypothetical protein
VTRGTTRRWFGLSTGDFMEPIPLECCSPHERSRGDTGLRRSKGDSTVDRAGGTGWGARRMRAACGSASYHRRCFRWQRQVAPGKDRWPRRRLRGPASPHFWTWDRYSRDDSRLSGCARHDAGAARNHRASRIFPRWPPPYRRCLADLGAAGDHVWLPKPIRPRRRPTPTAMQPHQP